MYVTMGGIPPLQNKMPLGHEAAGEVVAVGAEVADVAVGDHVVINPVTDPSGIIGNGGPQGGLSEYLLIAGARRGVSFEVIPPHIPFNVAALNEPMAVAFRAAKRCEPRATDKVLVFGAGPIGLGAVMAFKSMGVKHVVVADVIRSRLAKALQIGADDVIDSSTEDIRKRLIELHGEGKAMFPGAADTDIYLDAAGVPAVIESAVSLAKKGATVGVVAVHKQPVPINFISVISSELNIVGSFAYESEFFEVTQDLIVNWEKYATIISHTFPFEAIDEALHTATTPGAADKVVVVRD